MVIVSCAYTERSYPAIAIEVQGALGIVGFGFDMLVACSAATFALQRAHDALAAGSARGVLVINPELTSPQVNYCDRDSHFIFGDVATAVVLEHESTCVSQHSYRILGTKAVTQFSNNIRSNFGYVGRAEGGDPYDAERLFHQNGRKVFKEVCPMAAAHLEAQVTSLGLGVSDIRRWWLHQANLNMNQLITRKLLGTDPSNDVAPIVLDRYANTASAGSIIAFAQHHEDLHSGRSRRDLLVRRGLFDRQPSRTEALTIPTEANGVIGGGRRPPPASTLTTRTRRNAADRRIRAVAPRSTVRRFAALPQADQR